VILLWQIDTKHEGTITSEPAAPESPATFIVVDADRAEAIERTGATMPHDHLLLGVLCAEAGLRERAAAELRMAAEQPNADARIERLIASLDRWPR